MDSMLPALCRAAGAEGPLDALCVEGAEPEMLPARRLVTGGALELMAGDRTRARFVDPPACAFFANVLVVGVSYRYCSVTGSVVVWGAVVPAGIPGDER